MRTREYIFTAPDICDERDLRPKLIDMELQRLGRMYSRGDPALFSELFGELDDGEIQELYMDMVALEARDA
jgi:hypothetical protein